MMLLYAGGRILDGAKRLLASVFAVLVGQELALEYKWIVDIANYMSHRAFGLVLGVVVWLAPSHSHSDWKKGKRDSTCPMGVH